MKNITKEAYLACKEVVRVYETEAHQHYKNNCASLVGKKVKFKNTPMNKTGGRVGKTGKIISMKWVGICGGEPRYFIRGKGVSDWYGDWAFTVIKK